jgi:hypothetical protein
MFNAKAFLLLVAVATTSANSHLRHGPPPRQEVDPSYLAAIHADLTVYGKPDCLESFAKDLQDEIATALAIDGNSVFVVPNEPHHHGPLGGPGGHGGSHGHFGGPDGHGGPGHHGGSHGREDADDVEAGKVEIHEHCKDDEVKFCTTFQNTHNLDRCMHEHLDEVAETCREVILRLDPHAGPEEGEKKDGTDADGCYTKEDGRWCPQIDGSWANVSTGETSSKGEKNDYDWDEKKDYNWDEKKDFDWDEKKDFDWDEKKDFDWDEKKDYNGWVEGMKFRVVVFAHDATAAEELRLKWAAFEQEQVQFGKAQSVKVETTAMAMSESANLEAGWIETQREGPPHHHGVFPLAIGAMVCALAAALVVAFRQRRRANTLQTRLDYEMNDAHNLATPTLGVNIQGVAVAQACMGANKESLLSNKAAAAAPQMPDEVFGNVENPISIATL